VPDYHTADQLPYDATMTPTEIATNISEVTARIRAAEGEAERPAGAVSLLAVSKTKPPALIRLAYAQGLTAFGENYAQEMAEKARAVADLNISWHFIGPIQSNKTAVIAEICDWVHSVDRLKIAQRLSQQRPSDREPLNLLLQINISGEDTKAGVSPAAAPALIDQIAALPNLIVRGLMAIPAPASTRTDPQAPFRALRLLQEQLAVSHPNLDTLSMGMSADLEAAIAEGATLVRVGTDIFGARYN